MFETEFGPDIIPDNAYAAVGRALSAWERVEVHLAELYSLFIGKWNEIDPIVEYGKSNSIFSNRIQAVEHAGEKYFSHAGRDSTMFNTLVADIKKISHKRHQLAHGIVMTTGSPSEKARQAHLSEYAVRPAWHSISSLTKHSGRHEVYGIWAGGYDYKAADVLEIVSQFEALSQRTKNMIRDLTT